MKQNLLMKYDLVFNGKIIDKNEDLGKIENLKEIALVEKKSNEDKKEWKYLNRYFYNQF